MTVVPLCTEVHGVTVNYKAMPIHCIAMEMRFTARQQKGKDTSMIHPLALAALVVVVVAPYWYLSLSY